MTTRRTWSWVLLTLFVGMCAASAKEKRRSDVDIPREFLRNQVANTRTLIEVMLRRADLDKDKLLSIYQRTERWRRRPDLKLVQGVEDELWALTGPGVVRVAVREEGVQLDNSGPLKLVLVAARSRPVFIIVKNKRTSHARIHLASDAVNGLAVEGKTRVVWAGRTMGFAFSVTPKGPVPGTFALSLSVTFHPEGKPVEAHSVRIPVHVERRGTGRLKVALRYAATQRPARGRVYLTGSDGGCWKPEGAFARATMTGDEFFYAEGEFELDMPAGEARIEVVRGTEYRPLQARVDIKPGQTAELSLDLKRLMDMPSLGWRSGDMHIHANYTKDEFVTPERVLTQVLGEDLNIANMNVANSTGAWVHDRKYFEGRPNRLSRPNHVICWNEEFRNYRLYGHMCMIGLKKLVEPVYTGFADAPHWADFPPNYDLAKNAQEQGGAVTYPHPFWFADKFGFRWASAREFPADLALGVIDAIDVLSNADDQRSMMLWYGVLNCGLRCAVSAGSDAFTNVRRHYIPGADRVYVHVGPKFNYRKWIEAYKKGRSFATNGPLLFFTANDCLPGEELRFPADKKALVRVKLKVISLLPLDAVEIVVNGKVAAAKKPEPGQETTELVADIPLKRSSWIAGRCSGPRHRLNTMNDPVFAHSSPVYCILGDQAIGSIDHLVFYRDWVDELWENTAEDGKFKTPADKEHVRQVFLRAKKIYQDMLKNAQREVLDF
ncbi:MAG: CehA/McbA family metallohydrolase [Planctomycetes bacterium]|nr:CehA/McbA family metallohydrolase [Planctomycetota bacterium]